jgi:hypothetical protein
MNERIYTNLGWFYNSLVQCRYVHIKIALIRTISKLELDGLSNTCYVDRRSTKRLA